jgi:hypothetical protein
MFRRTRLVIVALFWAALTTSAARALPLTPQERPAQKQATWDLVTAGMDWVSSLFGIHRVPADGGDRRHASLMGQEKEGSQLDPNGSH